jgi:hypothetical protein
MLRQIADLGLGSFGIIEHIDTAYRDAATAWGERPAQEGYLASWRGLLFSLRA